MKIYIVWNAARTEGFATHDRQLAYEVRKGSDSNCFHEDGVPSEAGAEFCIRWAGDDCTIVEVEV